MILFTQGTDEWECFLPDNLKNTVVMQLKVFRKHLNNKTKGR